MANSSRSLFSAGAAGNASPILLKWWAQEGISIPGETWFATVGWAASVLLFAVFAGYVAAFVWKEKTPRRAFIVGLALPYILWGLLADVSGVSKIRPARGQAAWIHMWEQRGEVVTFQVEVLAEDTGKPLPEAQTRIYPAGARVAPVAASTVGAYALPPGKYDVVASAPGYLAMATTVELPGPAGVSFTLKRSPWWNELLNGAKLVFLPQRSPHTLPQTLPYTLP